VDGARPRLCFLDDLDPEVFWEIMSIANPVTTGVIVLSESGESEPMLLQLMRCLEYWHGMIDAQEIPRHFVVITSPSSSRLMRMVDRWKLPWWRYPTLALPELGCFSPPLLAPLGLAGFDRARFNQGSGATCAQFFQGQLKGPLEMAALAFAGHKAHAMQVHRIWGHGAIFHSITAWMEKSSRQLLKNAPYRWVSSSEKMKSLTLTTLFFERHVARERLVPDFWKDLPQLRTLAQTPMLHWVKERHEGLCHQEIQQGHFLRRVNVHSLNEETLGALFMNHVLETLLIDTMYGALD
jgi:glucose-6-phosphate isomerase